MNIKSVGKGVEKLETKEFTCTGCESVIEYNKTDVQETGSWTRTGVEESEWNGYKYVVCPVCKRTHRLEDVHSTY
jgi:hypothetical protein